jgi:hypothetical protein
VALEGFDFFAVLLDDFWMGASELRDEFEDVVHLDIVAQAWEDFGEA